MTDRDPTPDVVDFDVDLFGAERAAARLTERLAEVHATTARAADDGKVLLQPPFDAGHDRVEGVPSAPAVLVVFGAFATPWSHQLADVLDGVLERLRGTAAIAWRHYPDPVAHPRAAVYALATEAAAEASRFWPLTRALLRERHDDPADLRASMVRAGLDPERTLAAMRAGTGIDRIVQDVTSAYASAVIAAPTLFVGGERYSGKLDPLEVSRALEGLPPAA